MHIVIALVVVIIGGVVAVLFLKKDSSAPAVQTTGTLKTYDACSLLTKEKAAQVLGTSLTLGEEATPVSSSDIKVTNCTYNNGAGNARDIVSASVLVRSPTSSLGVDSNTEAFANSATVGDVAVSGYGEKAMWNNISGQLNILKDNNWIIVTYGTAPLGSRTLDETRKLADLLF